MLLTREMLAIIGKGSNDRFNSWCRKESFPNGQERKSKTSNTQSICSSHGFITVRLPSNTYFHVRSSEHDVQKIFFFP